MLTPITPHTDPLVGSLSDINLIPQLNIEESIELQLRTDIQIISAIKSARKSSKEVDKISSEDSFLRMMIEAKIAVDKNEDITLSFLINPINSKFCESQQWGANVIYTDLVNYNEVISIGARNFGSIYWE